MASLSLPPASSLLNSAELAAISCSRGNGTVENGLSPSRSVTCLVPPPGLQPVMRGFCAQKKQLPLPTGLSGLLGQMLPSAVRPVEEDRQQRERLPQPAGGRGSALAPPAGVNAVTQPFLKDCSPAPGADVLDPIDQALLSQLLSAERAGQPRVRARKLGAGHFELDGRPVRLRWDGDAEGHGQLLVRECISDGSSATDDLPLATYLSLAANVSASLAGRVSGAPAIGRVPQKLRLTFDGKPDAGPWAKMDQGQRLSSMFRACEEARLRREAAEAYERALANAAAKLGLISSGRIPVFGQPPDHPSTAGISGPTGMPALHSRIRLAA